MAKADSLKWWGKIGALAAAVFGAGILGSCGDDSISPQLEYEYGIRPLADTINWQSTGVIWAEAARGKTASLLVVGASWCGWCRKLESETFRDSTVMGLLEQYFNPCKIDGDSDSMITVGDTVISCYTATRTLLNVSGYPTVIFYDNDGSFLAKYSGFREPQQFADLLWYIVQQARSD